LWPVLRGEGDRGKLTICDLWIYLTLIAAHLIDDTPFSKGSEKKKQWDLTLIMHKSVIRQRFRIARGINLTLLVTYLLSFMPG